MELGDERGTIPLQPTPGSVYITLLTSMFMHGSLMHLLGNMLFLWIFGDNVEDDLSHARYTAFYLVTGVIASLSHVVSTFVFADNPFIPSLGASGAISAVMGGYLVLHPHRRVRVIMLRMLTTVPGVRCRRPLVPISADQRVRRDWTGRAGGRRRRVHGAHRRVHRRRRAGQAVRRRKSAAGASRAGLRSAVAVILGLLIVLAIVTVVCLGIRQKRAELKNPFSAAFGMTFAAVLLVVPGLLGYELHKSNWFFMRVTVSDGPVWRQIYLGLVFVLPAIYFWRKALRTLP